MDTLLPKFVVSPYEPTSCRRLERPVRLEVPHHPLRRLEAVGVRPQRLNRDCGEDDDPTCDRPSSRPLRASDPDPQRAEDDFEQANQRYLGSRDQTGAEREEDQPESALPEAEQEQETKVGSPDLPGMDKR